MDSLKRRPGRTPEGGRPGRDGLGTAVADVDGATPSRVSYVAVAETICSSAATVVAVGAAAAVAGGRRAAPWAAASAAVWCASPWLGTVRVNGEILAAPFVAAAYAQSSSEANGTVRDHHRS